MKIGKYQTQIIKRLMYIFHINGWHKYPASAWWYKDEGWICDSEEIKLHMKLDDFEFPEDKETK